MDSTVVNRSAAWNGYGGIKIIRKAIVALMMAVFLGYVLIWILTGTHIFRTWFQKVRAHTISAYFEWQGPMILVFTFPILFIAVLGCVYLHLGKKLVSDDDMGFRNVGERHQRFGVWKRPMIIKGLGIVSRIELSIFIIFLLFLLWFFSVHLHFFFSQAAQRATQRGEKLWEAKLDRCGLALGLAGNVCLAFLFFPVTRNSSVLPLLGLTSEGSIKYHVWAGHLTMLLFTAHGALYIIYWLITHRISQMLKWDAMLVSNVAGELSLLFGLFLWATTYSRSGKNMFELFFYTHYFYILFIIFYVFHLGISFSYTFLPGFYLFLIDRFLRFLQSRRGVRLVSARVLPCQTLELNFSKTQALSYTPTSMVFINVPSISKLQWHPFTISSSSNLEPDGLSVLIKNEGTWTEKLYEMLSSKPPVDRLVMSVEGPYGPISTHFLRYDKLVMVSGGSGIAPFISLIRELIFLNATIKTITPPLLLISSFKHSSDLAILDLLLPISTIPPSELHSFDLRIEPYVTRDRDPPFPSENQPIPIKTIWFDPNASSDSPMSPVLGPNGWIWLAAIISSSFVVFLIFVGILTRFYIYPIDHNTNRVYSHSAQAALNMMLICVSIAVAATAAVLWNMKGKAMEARDIQNAKGAAKEVSPNTWFERELESLPLQCLGKPINVHYGGRPDLKRILLECKESSVGVLVCGPKKMRHDVAAICSSGLAGNLHFESISFSW